MVGGGGGNDGTSGGNEGIGTKDVINAQTDASFFAGCPQFPQMRGTPCVVESAADMQIGETERKRIEISDHDDRIRTRLYLLTDDLRLLVAEGNSPFPFLFQLVKIIQVGGNETIGLQMVVKQSERVCADHHIATIAQI